MLMEKKRGKEVVHPFLHTLTAAEFLFCLQFFQRHIAFIHTSFCASECNFIILFNFSASAFNFFFFFCICCDSYTLFLMFASDKSAAVFCEQNVIVVCCSFQETRCFCFLKPMARNLFVLGKPDLNTSLGTSLLHISFSLGVLCVL